MNYKSYAVVVSLAVALAGPAMGQQLGDYGDAPDPNFPSLFARGGPVHLDVSREWIGIGNTSDTTVEPDSNQVDVDASDFRGWWVRMPDATGRQTTWFVTRVSYDPALSGAGEAHYINVLVDIDGDGVWEGGDEWAVQNAPVDFSILPPGVNNMFFVHTVPDSIVPVNLIGHYVRVTFSTTQVANSSGAWGQFARGETEDWTDVRIDTPPDKLFWFFGLKHFKFEKLKETGHCPHGRWGVSTPLCPNHDKVYRLHAYVPWGTNLFRLSFKRWDPCGQCPGKMCPHSQITRGAFAINVPCGWTGNVIVAAGIVPGQVNDFDFVCGVTDRPAHDQIEAEYIVAFDPEGDYVQATCVTRTGVDPDQTEDSLLWHPSLGDPPVVSSLGVLPRYAATTPVQWNDTGGRKFVTTARLSRSMSSPFFSHIEQEDRSAGVRLQSSSTFSPTVGYKTSGKGILSRDGDGNLYIDISPSYGSVSFFGPGSDPFDGQVCLRPGNLGGSEVTGGFGLRNAALYVKTFGRVVNTPSYDGNSNLQYDIDDGSGRMVKCCDLFYDGYEFPMPQRNQYVAVVGPIEFKKIGGTTQAQVLTESVQILQY